MGHWKSKLSLAFKVHCIRACDHLWGLRLGPRSSVYRGVIPFCLSCRVLDSTARNQASRNETRVIQWWLGHDDGSLASILCVTAMPFARSANHGYHICSRITDLYLTRILTFSAIKILAGPATFFGVSRSRILSVVRIRHPCILGIRLSEIINKGSWR